MYKNQSKKIVCFGEVLWDILPAGAVPGGAPMNVAYHLNRLGKSVSMISKIGLDENGKKLMEFFALNNIPAELVQTDTQCPTGTVLATPGPNHEMQYDIVKPVAYDFIDAAPAAMEALEHAGYFIFGSLAARSPHSRTTLLQMIEAAQTKVLDINVRLPHFEKDLAEILLKKADILKLNENEMDLLVGWYSDISLFEDKIRMLSDRYSIPKIIVTKGADGAAYYDGEKFYDHPGYKVTVADTVGSGDSFLAGFLSNMIDGISPEKSIEFACRLGSFIATQKGACPKYKIENGEIREEK